MISLPIHIVIQGKTVLDTIKALGGSRSPLDGPGGRLVLMQKPPVGVAAHCLMSPGRGGIALPGRAAFLIPRRAGGVAAAMA
jgi:hypothetical protein